MKMNADSPGSAASSGGGTFTKSYCRLLIRLLRLPAFWGPQLVIQVVRIFYQDWEGVVITLMVWASMAAAGAYLPFDSLPRRYWFEGDCLKVEDMSGEVLSMQSWVKFSTWGLQMIQGKTPSRTLSFPLCAYVLEAKGE